MNAVLGTRSYRAWIVFFAVIAIVAGGVAFGHRVGGLAYYPRISAISGWDGSFYFYWLRSPLWGGDFDFTDDIRDCGTLPPYFKELALQLPRTPLGLQPNKYGVGWAFVNTPAYVTADEMAHVWRKLSPTSAPVEDGVGPIYQLSVLLWQLGLAIASLFLAIEVLKEWFSRDVAVLAVLVMWLGGFLFLYQTYLVAAAHNTVFFALTACYASAHAFRRNPGAWLPWLFCGASAGLLVITRYQTLVYLFYPVVLALQVVRMRAGFSSSVSRIVMALLAFFAVVSVQLIAWKMVYGSWLLYSYAGESFYLLQPRFFDVLFSPFHGLFYWSPFLLVGLCGFVAWLFRDGARVAIRRPELCWLLSLLITYWLNAAWQTWWFGAAFGSRAFEGCVLFFMAGGAYGLERLSLSRARHAVLAVALVFAMANLALASAFVKTWIPREAPVTHREMWQGLLRHEAAK
jgi:hypothetical protein